jgi:UDP-N-acetylglucosamine:LPS N-acetylglucosamine transferase
MWPRFLAAVEDFPPDLLLSVFATGAAASSRYKAAHPEVVTVVLCTDSWVHRLWVHEHIDLFLVTSTLGAASVHRYRPRATVGIVPRPVRPEFYVAPSRPEARTRLGVPADARCVLVMSGSWGIGPLDAVAERLARDGCWVLAVAGTNAKLEARLRALEAREPRVLAFGFTDRVPELMSACDAVVTSSGDTCSEARALGRSIVLLDVVPGHGRENLAHELELGDAVASGSGVDEVAEAVGALLDDVAGQPERPRASRADWDRALLAALAQAGLVLRSA